MTTPAPVPRATPPRGTTRVVGERPADQAPCPGCGELIHFKKIACVICWRQVPGQYKSDFGTSAPGSQQRARVVAAMRAWMRSHIGQQGGITNDDDPLPGGRP